jgi:5'-deoxynucleotidase YfbR-like HD superfamily hydrolase
LGAVQKGDHPTYLKMVTARYEKIQKEFTEEFAHTHSGRCPGKQSFQDLYALIQADKKVAKSFDVKAFEHINKIEKAVKNYENSLYNREHSSSPKVTLEHTPTAEKKLNMNNQFKP